MNASVQRVVGAQTSAAQQPSTSSTQKTSNAKQRGVVLADASSQKATLAKENRNQTTLRAALHRSAAGGVNTRTTPIIRLTAPAEVTAGSTATLRWSTENADSCEASGDWSGTKALSGSEQTGPIDEASEFRMTCSGPDGKAISKVEIGVIQPIPEIDFTAADTAVLPGSTTELTWMAVNAANCRAGQDWTGDKPVSGSEVVGPIDDNSIFSITCANSDGFEVTDLVQVTINVAALSWTPPTQNTDGSDYTNPGGYRIYWGTESRDYINFVDIADPSVVEFTLELPPNLYYFAATAYNTDDLESDYSGEATKAVGMPATDTDGDGQ